MNSTQRDTHLDSSMSLFLSPQKSPWWAGDPAGPNVPMRIYKYNVRWNEEGRSEQCLQLQAPVQQVNVWFDKMEPIWRDVTHQYGMNIITNCAFFLDQMEL